MDQIDFENLGFKFEYASGTVWYSSIEASCVYPKKYEKQNPLLSSDHTHNQSHYSLYDIISFIVSNLFYN